MVRVGLGRMCLMVRILQRKQIKKKTKKKKKKERRKEEKRREKKRKEEKRREEKRKKKRKRKTKRKRKNARVQVAELEYNFLKEIKKYEDKENKLILKKTSQLIPNSPTPVSFQIIILPALSSSPTTTPQARIRIPIAIHPFIHPHRQSNYLQQDVDVQQRQHESGYDFGEIEKDFDEAHDRSCGC
ncbi:hypothetical protein T310_10266 [Rasamsonia emersonii CBS 393.64]|uniref:Uncharacterized protein n=1 Tax=Rasamsonia emersonii (strain ATCC 16479 / CBS 393.64 / IMI 116815) TaxID=1408163 RepID=A0A0F4YD98_RASE3|nr:hypothetical protein T310_10266 [Rasamsonia emersonii CBS 393.64]KKA16164.1 hypothetical protein T310_10266 [Rasamsonia emersonii CBS 393.64]